MSNTNIRPIIKHRIAKFHITFEDNVENKFLGHLSSTADDKVIDTFTFDSYKERDFFIYMVNQKNDGGLNAHTISEIAKRVQKTFEYDERYEDLENL